MTLPVIYHRESFGWCGAYGASTDFIGFDQLYVQTRWEDASGNPALVLRGWLNNAGFLDCSIVQSAPGNPVKGYAVRSSNKHVLGIALAKIGMGTTRTSGIGIAFTFNQGGQIGNSVLCEFGDVTGSYRHLSIETNAIGQIIARRGHDGVVLGTSDGTAGNAGSGCIPFLMGPGADNSAPPMTHVEIVPTFNATTGTVQVKANEQLILNLTGKNTTNTNVLSTDATCGIIQPCVGINRGLPDGAGGQTLADIVVHDATGAGWIGDVGVFWLPADQVGNYTAGTAGGTGSPASQLIALKDVSTPTTTPNIGSDGDASYVSLDDTGLPKAISMIIKAFPADAKSILEVAPLELIRKDDGGTSVGRLGMRVSGTEVDNGSDIAVPTGYTPFQFGRQTNPHTSAAWSVSDVIDVFHRRSA